MGDTTQQDRMMSISTPLEEDFLLLNKLSAIEHLSELFEYNVELLHEEDEPGDEPTIIDVKKILGKGVTIQITQKDGTKRLFNGMVSNFSQGNRDARFSYYRATIVPQLWLLTQRSQSRIFQQITVPDILKKVLDGLDINWAIQGTYEPRNYCVQYRETDFDFASRLMEEEGIFYYFKHEEKAHKMVIADTNSHPDCPPKNEIPFFLKVVSDASQEGYVSSISSWLVDYKIQSGKVTLWDHHFQLPGKNLSAEKPARHDIGADQNLEIYDFPGGYAKEFDGVSPGGGDRDSDIQKITRENQKIVGVRMQEIDAQYKTVNGDSDCCSLTAGHRFELINHPNSEFNKLQYTLVSTIHEIEQSPDYVSDEEHSSPYRNSFTCIPNSVPFRPVQKTPKPVIQGSQTAIVVGPAGEEIFTDKFGRVKVQFHWDREGQGNSDSSCWIRVAQSWAGKKWGMMFIPRIGMEVKVEYLEGDPDQPIITGCVYNADTMPPYDLPAEKTKMTIKSDSSLGGGGFNEFRFEDKKGKEQIFTHAEKDIDIRVKNDRRELILRDRHLIVDRDKRERIKRDVHRIVERDVIEELKRDHHLKLKGKVAKEITESYSQKIGTNFAEKVGGNYAIKVDGNYTVEAKQIVLKADVGLTINVGGNFVTIDSSGVSIKGTMVNINSGGSALSPTSGTLVAPLAVVEAEIADNADPGSKIPTYTYQRKQMSPIQKLSINAPSHNPNSPRNEKKKSWIEIKLVDDDGKPVPGEYYRVTLPDGSTLAEGSLNEKGEARVDNIDPGNCIITFPNLHRETWERK